MVFAVSMTFFTDKNTEFGRIGMDDSEWKKILIGSDNQRRAPEARTKGHRLQSIKMTRLTLDIVLKHGFLVHVHVKQVIFLYLS